MCGTDIWVWGEGAGWGSCAPLCVSLRSYYHSVYCRGRSLCYLRSRGQQHSHANQLINLQVNKMNIQEIKALAGENTADYANKAAMGYLDKSRETDCEKDKQYYLYQYELAMAVYSAHNAEYWAESAETTRNASFYSDESEQEFDAQSRDIDAEYHRAQAELRFHRSQHHRQLWRDA